MHRSCIVGDIAALKSTVLQKESEVNVARWAVEELGEEPPPLDPRHLSLGFT